MLVEKVHRPHSVVHVFMDLALSLLTVTGPLQTVPQGESMELYNMFWKFLSLELGSSEKQPITKCHCGHNTV